jgi:hypothetical protein
VKTRLPLTLGVVALGVVAGCKSEPRAVAVAVAASATSAAVSPVLPKSAAVLATPAPQHIALGLETEKIGEGPALRVFVSAPALGLREPIGELRFPFTCVALASEAAGPWRVSCSPRYRQTLAEASVVSGELLLRVTEAKQPPREVKKPLPPGVVLDLPDADASSRLDSCEGVTLTRELSVTFPTANWAPGFTPDSITYLALPGLAEPLPLVKQAGWWQGCRAHDVDGAVEFRCPEGRRHFARITAEASAVRYEWQDTERHVGRVLVPCSARPKLVRPETFSMGYRYF